jgi:hypothetical protein
MYWECPCPFPHPTEGRRWEGHGCPHYRKWFEGSRERDPGNHVEVSSTKKKLPEPFLNITFLKESQLLLIYAVVQLQ